MLRGCLDSYMCIRSSFIALTVVLCALFGGELQAHDSNDSDTTADAKQSSDVAATAAGDEDADSEKADSKSAKKKSKYPPFSKLTEETTKIEGLLTLHQGETKLFAELESGDFNRDFIVLMTIARGIGQTPLLGGFSWGFGDDAVWQFRKAGEHVHVVRRNVRFRADKDSPSAEAVRLAYTDSVLFSLPIAGKSPSGATLVDLSPVFMSDLPQISMVLPGFRFSPQKSTWGKNRGFDKNVELQVAATYTSDGNMEIDSVPDSRGVTINVHYSISRLPETNFKPREADDRVGYFLTAVKDFSKSEEEDRFVRYINRWNLQKADADAEISPPKKPIVFWLEKTIPFKYRKPIRDGLEEWNLAFEKAGFYDAIDVQQQPDNADWDPGDINYNTFRWITSGAGFAMGPSRVNPLTGEILDADIIFDADFLQYWKVKYETFTPAGIELFTGGPVDLKGYHEQQRRIPTQLRGHGPNCTCNLLNGASHQFALAATAAVSRSRDPKELDRLIMEGLKEVAMHEVGHTLGLRHNFKASTLYSVDELHDQSKTSKTGLSASVMDYNPVNLAPKGVEQGDYYSTTIGPYDYWAIEYGYKPTAKGQSEEELLKAIASRSGEPQLAYATDEDTRSIDPDPHSIRFDFSNDLVKYAQQQADLVAELMPGVAEQMTEEGDGYQKARRAFGVLLSAHGQAMYAMSRYIGGIYVSRSHKGDANAAAPFEPVDAEKQREAMQLLGEQVFNDKPFQIDPALYNKLMSSRWNHWGTDIVDRSDYPVHETILMWQDRILSKVMSSLTLRRLHDAELKTPADTDAYTTAELLGELTSNIFDNLSSLGADGATYTNRKPAISSLDRNLQRTYLRRLATLALGETSAPEDCQAIASSQLRDLKGELDVAINKKLDGYTAAHLRDSKALIEKVLEARIMTTL